MTAEKNRPVPGFDFAELGIEQPPDVPFLTPPSSLPEELPAEFTGGWWEGEPVGPPAPGDTP